MKFIALAALATAYRINYRQPVDPIPRSDVTVGAEDHQIANGYVPVVAKNINQPGWADEDRQDPGVDWEGKDTTQGQNQNHFQGGRNQLWPNATSNGLLAQQQFATGMNGDEDLGQDIQMKGEPFHYRQQSLAMRRRRDGPKFEKGDDSDDYNGEKESNTADRFGDAWMKGHWATKQ